MWMHIYIQYNIHTCPIHVIIVIITTLGLESDLRTNERLNVYYPIRRHHHRHRQCGVGDHYPSP